MPVPCAYCQTMNVDGVRFCRQCGQSLPVCARCGASLRPGSRFCNKCGAAVATPATPGLPYAGTGRLPAQYLLNSRYLILKKVGQGGMGAVYLASDTRLQGKLWAVKEMATSASTTPQDLQECIARFQQEAQILARLDHPGIPKVPDAFEEAGRHYLVMEYVDGQTLDELFNARQQRPFTEAEVRPWLGQLCDVLGYLHGQQPAIVFRDLKPANIMLDRAGRIKLIDFGIARFFKAGKQADTASLGTEGFCAPEAFGKQTDARSDIYSLGATLYLLLTAKDLIAYHFAPPPIQSVNPALSGQMAAAVNRALLSQPDQRWQSTRELQQALGITPAPTNAGHTPAPLPPPLVGPPVIAPPPRKPTTRLLLAVVAMPPAFLIVGLSSLLMAVIVFVWAGGPYLRDHLPFIWYTVPGFALFGPLGFAAARRIGAAFLSHVAVTGAGSMAWGARDPRFLHDPTALALSILAGGVAIELGMLLIPRFLPKKRDEAWPREMALFGVAAMLTTLVALIFFGGQTLAPMSLAWALGLGMLGWFLGDLVQEYLYFRKVGMRRPTP